MRKKAAAVLICAAMTVSMLAGCSDSSTVSDEETSSPEETAEETSETSSEEADADAEEDSDAAESSSAAVVSEKDYIEETLNLANNEEQEWTYTESADAWVLSIVTAVVYPELVDQQGVSVCVPGAYVTGIDTDGDGTADVTAADAGEEGVPGSLVIDYEAGITSTNGQTYTASTAPVILNTGAAGYGSSNNTKAATTYAQEGYINVACGNRGKNDTAVDEDGNEYYTGDAPSCLVDQKNAARFVKYNILLGNLPGSVDYWVSTGGSGGGAHAAMFAATSNNPDFYDYEIEAGAVGVYLLEDGTYSTTVTIDGTDYELSDGAWGCIAYSAITSLVEADMAMAFEYNLDADYEFGSDFQAMLASFLSESYMEYINGQDLSAEESAVGFDLNDDGDLDDTIALTIEYDPDTYPETNGYYGTYLDLYLAEFISNLQWYLDNLDYTEDWTWFDEGGAALGDDEVAAMTTEDKAAAFIEGRYAKSSSGGMGGGPGDLGDLDLGDLPDGGPMDLEGGPDGGDIDITAEEGPDGEIDIAENSGPDGNAGIADGAPDDLPDGDLPDDIGGPDADGDTGRSFDNAAVAENSAGDTMDVGTPDAGTTQAAGSSVDSANYATYEEMLASYEEDIAAIQAGDAYGKNIVELYNPLNYIGAEGTDNPTWVRILMGASEGDMSMFSSLNLQIAMLNAGIDANIEWQWDGGHVPSEILSESFALYVDQMYGEYVSGVTIETPAAEAQTENGTADEATGTDLSSWVDDSDLSAVSFSLADAASYRTSGASKATPGFDVIDYGQEDYVFGNEEQDGRHWDPYLLEILQEHQDELAPLFNSGS